LRQVIEYFRTILFIYFFSILWDSFWWIEYKLSHVFFNLRSFLFWFFFFLLLILSFFLIRFLSFLFFFVHSSSSLACMAVLEFLHVLPPHIHKETRNSCLWLCFLRWVRTDETERESESKTFKKRVASLNYYQVLFYSLDPNIQVKHPSKLTLQNTIF